MMTVKLLVGLACFCFVASLWFVSPPYNDIRQSTSLEPPSANKIPELWYSREEKEEFPEIKRETIPSKKMNETLRIQIASDLHIEFYEAHRIPEDIIIPKAPILALLGDIGLAFTPQLRLFLHDQAKRFETVLYIAGNHEYYNLANGERKTVDEQEQWLKDVCSELENLHYMEKKSMVIHGVKILATTLWSYIPPSVEALAGSSMNDYQLSYIQRRGEDFSKQGVRKLSANETRQWHTENVHWLETELALAVKHQQPVLVLTHHTPSLQGTSNPQYGGNKLSHCFSTDLTHLLQHPAVRAWACGHTHWNFDMVVPPQKERGDSGATNGTRLLSNQRGYSDRPSTIYDNAGIVLEISSQWRE